MTHSARVDATMMQRAVALAQEAANIGEVPVGAVVGNATHGAIFGEAHNEAVTSGDPTAHAEILALRRAAACIGNYRLVGLTLWVTLEPCAMCAGAISHARLDTVVFAAPDPKTGAVAHGVKLFDSPFCLHKPLWRRGPLAEGCSDMLRTFFAQRR